MDTVTSPMYLEGLGNVVETRWFMLVLFQMTCAARTIGNTYQITCCKHFGLNKPNLCSPVLLFYTQDIQTQTKMHANFINSQEGSMQHILETVQ